MASVWELVNLIRASASEEEAVSNCCLLGFGEAWVKAVYSKKPVTLVLDGSYDAHGQGVAILTALGISEEIQSAMWVNWATLSEEDRAIWVDDLKNIDQTDFEDARRYALLLIDLLE